MKKVLIVIVFVVCLMIPISNIRAFQITDLVQVLADCEVVGGELNTWLKNAFKFAQYAGVGLAVILTGVDFIQVIGGSKDDDLKNAFNRTIKRLVAVILLLLTSALITFVIDIVNPVIDTEIPNCVEDV